MRKKELTKLVLQMSEGVCSSLLNYLLFLIFYSLEISPLGSPTNLKRAEFLAWRDLERFNSATIKGAIARTRSRGFIKADLTLTKEGRERLNNLFPRYFGERKWDGNWYLVVYDIPETKKRRREILREALKNLGFGQLQASVFVSPFNFLGDVEKVIKEYRLSPYVVLAISDKLGQEEARSLATRVWRLEELNFDYNNLLRERKEFDDVPLYFKYLSLLAKDPQLPRELLPENWKGEELHDLFKKKK